MKRRVLLKIEYRGTAYSGWQRQKNAISIQQKIEDALSDFLSCRTVIHGAGRTDKGVHALAQYAHFDTVSGVPPHSFAYILNNLLPPDIRIINSTEVPTDFHARFCAIKKTYIYKVWIGLIGSALRWDTHCLVKKMPDIETMKEAAKYFLGTHDFAAFKTAGTKPKTTVRTVHSIDININPHEPNELLFTVCGNSFLYNMVRVMCAQLLKVGYGKMPPERIPELLRQNSRTHTKETAPAQGLYLSEIEYPKIFD